MLKQSLLKKLSSFALMLMLSAAFLFLNEHQYSHNASDSSHCELCISFSKLDGVSDNTPILAFISQPFTPHKQPKGAYVALASQKPHCRGPPAAQAV